MSSRTRSGVRYAVSHGYMYVIDECKSLVWVGRREKSDLEDYYDNRHVARIKIIEVRPAKFFLERECVPVLDNKGPWVKETRDLQGLNTYLSLFGLGVVEPTDLHQKLDVEIVEKVEPRELCSHVANLFRLKVAYVRFTDDEGYIVDVVMPCSRCNATKRARIVIPEEMATWYEGGKEE